MRYLKNKKLMITCITIVVTLPSIGMVILLYNLFASTPTFNLVEASNHQTSLGSAKLYSYDEIPETTVSAFLSYHDPDHFNRNVTFLTLGNNIITRGGCAPKCEAGRIDILSYKIQFKYQFADDIPGDQLAFHTLYYPIVNNYRYSREEIVAFVINNYTFYDGTIGFEAMAQATYNKPLTLLTNDEQIELVAYMRVFKEVDNKEEHLIEVKEYIYELMEE
jgi:hypothetical protein